MKLEIDRKRWLRGEGGSSSQLLRHDGKMCCLGFYGCALGADKDTLRNVADPEDTPRAPWPEWLLQDVEIAAEMDWRDRVHTDECIELMRLNDNKAIGDDLRESTITRIFASHGVEVTFVDGQGEA